jgi:hypothetical protein
LKFSKNLQIKKWREIKDIFLETRKKTSGFKNKLKKDWMSEETSEAIEKKKETSKQS